MPDGLASMIPVAGSAYAYNPRTGTGIATNRYVNEDGGWGESLITQNDKWIETRSYECWSMSGGRVVGGPT